MAKKNSSKAYYALLIACGLLALASANSCSSATQYQCPLCGGITVSSCQECDGYLNVGKYSINSILSLANKPALRPPTRFESVETKIGKSE